MVTEEDKGGEQELCFLVGSTAVGKSELALSLAEATGAWICSLDSMLVYRGMDIGTAKPSPEERERVPHFCIDLVDPPERFDAQRYLAEVEAARREAAARGRRLLFVGGTAFYLKLLVFGLFQGPPVDLEVRARLEERVESEGLAVLVGELARLDPLSAARIHPNDRKRILRALEVHEQTGKPMSELQRSWGWDGPAKPRPHRILGLRRSAELQEERIRERTRQMLEQGWVEEVRGIRDGCGFGPTSIQALGYRQVLRHLEGELDREACAAEIALKTRQFARRQRTWFRSFDVEWIDPAREDGIEGARSVLGL